MQKLLKDSRVLTALIALVVAVAAYFGIDLPHNELTAALTSGDTSHALTLILGALIGVLGGYGAASAQKGDKDADITD